MSDFGLGDDSIKSADSQKYILNSLIENFSNIGGNSVFYKDDNIFKSRVEKLNYKFYSETEKYISHKAEMEKTQDQLFIILFKQLSLYIEENERLNNLLRGKTDMDKSLKEKLEEINRREKDKNILNQTIINLKNTNNVLEKKLVEKSKIEEKLKSEIEALKGHLKFYKEKIKVELDFSKRNYVGGGKKINPNFLASVQIGSRRPEQNRTMDETLKLNDSNRVEIEKDSDLNTTEDNIKSLIKSPNKILKSLEMPKKKLGKEIELSEIIDENQENMNLCEFTKNIQENFDDELNSLIELEDKLLRMKSEFNWKESFREHKTHNSKENTHVNYMKELKENKSELKEIKRQKDMKEHKELREKKELRESKETNHHKSKESHDSKTLSSSLKPIKRTHHDAKRNLNKTINPSRKK